MLWQENELLMKVLGPKYPSTLISMFNHAAFLHDHDRNEDTRATLHTCYELQKVTMGSIHPYTDLSIACISQRQEAQLINS